MQQTACESAVSDRPEVIEKFGAGEGNRTLVISLEGCCSTIELHPRRRRSAAIQRRVRNACEVILGQGFPGLPIARGDAFAHLSWSAAITRPPINGTMQVHIPHLMFAAVPRLGPGHGLVAVPPQSAGGAG